MDRKKKSNDNELCLREGEVRRFSVIEQLLSKRIDQREAALELEISTRQVRRIAVKVRQMGAFGVVHAGRGRESGNKISAEKLGRIKQLLQEKYADFGASLAAEKLLEIDGIKISKESVRGLLIELGLHKPKRRKDRNIHQSRARRARFGELIQIDGSPHDWFEGRAEKCCLIVFIDDATSKITAAVFVPVESTNGYYLALQQHLQSYGLPVCLYSDRHGIFKINAKEAVSGDGRTEFKKCLDELKIAIIHAATPQAKGRVERANQTLQDRLIKEMRLKNISNIDAANAFLPEFIAKHNAKFAVTPLETKDAHRPLNLDQQQLQRILCNKEIRTLSKQLSFSYNGNFYLLKTKNGQVGYALRNQKITICNPPNQPIMAFYKDKKLEFTLLAKSTHQPLIADDKSINWHVNNLVKSAA